MITEEKIKAHHADCEEHKKLMLEVGQPPGEWDKEPNRVEWKKDNLSCLINRNPELLSLCGYVGVPKTHPLHGKPYQDIDIDIDVHGGLTFSGRCSGLVCHKQAQGEDDLWWFGFDCAHGMDIMPFDAIRVIDGPKRLWRTERHRFLKEAYRNLSYVIDETEKLAEQLFAEATPWHKIKTYVRSLVWASN